MQKILYIFCFLATHSLYAQQPVTATGSWFGRADVELAGMHNNYLTELVIKQKGNKVEGIFGYYFRDKYQSFFVHGRYNPKTREVIILNIPVIYYMSNSTVNSIDCNTNFIGTLINSRVSSSLKGYFYHDEKYKYTCPDLKVSYVLDREDLQHDSVLEAGTVSSAKIWKPQADDFVVDVAKTDKAAAPANPVPAETKAEIAPPVVKMDKQVPAAEIVPPVVRKEEPVFVRAVAQDDVKKIAEAFTQRKATLNQVFDVESDSVRLSFYDNGEVDGDSISVFVNNQVILTHQELTTKALTVYLHLDSTLTVNDISMFAENLGKYPPNTALMVVTDGKNRYEVFMSSSLTENATIQLRRKKNP